MKLVEFLASGVRGAESGTATFVLRGTASSAASVLYTNFEGTAQPGTNIISLDSNGAAEIYCNAYVDCEIKTSAGVTLRTVTVGDTSTMVEVRSDSFTGVNYSGAPTAVNEPITLQAVLNLWNNSAGATDFQVNPGSGAVNLSSALAGVSGLFFNVKDPQFGAVGDGVTDDTTAISNCITAAGGGIVFFPAGTYLVDVLTFSAANTTLLGSGPGSTIILGIGAGARVINITDNTSGGWKRIIGIDVSAGNAYTALINIEETQNLYFENCEFTGNNITGAIISRPDADGQTNCFFSNCLFTLGTGTDSAIANLSDDGESYFSVKNCFFSIPATFAGIVIDGPDFNVSGCEFDGSADSSGFTFIDPSSNETANRFLGTCTDSVFRTAGTTSVVFELNGAAVGSKFFESGNTFYGFDVTAVTDSSARLYNFSSAAGGDYQISLLSRLARSIRFSGAFSTTEALNFVQDYGNITLNVTDAGVLAITTAAQMAPGSETTIALVNSSGGTKTITFQGTVTFTNLANGGIAGVKLCSMQSAAGAFHMAMSTFNHD